MPLEPWSKPTGPTEAGQDRLRTQLWILRTQHVDKSLVGVHSRENRRGIGHSGYR